MAQQGISPVVNRLYGLCHPLLRWVARMAQQQRRTATNPVVNRLYGLCHPLLRWEGRDDACFDCCCASAFKTLGRADFVEEIGLVAGNAFQEIGTGVAICTGLYIVTSGLSSVLAIAIELIRGLKAWPMATL